MDSATTRLTRQKIAQLISDGLLCPWPRPHYVAHDYNAEVVDAVMALSPDERRAWLAEKRRERAALLATG